MNIPISEKYGVNPTFPICFWCGEKLNEVALLGKLPGDKEAPRYTVIDYEPCDKCRAIMEQGIVIIEVDDNKKSEYPPICGGYSPTGYWSVIKEEALDYMIKDKSILQEAKKTKKCLMPPDVFKKWFTDQNNQKQEG